MYKQSSQEMLTYTYVVNKKLVEILGKMAQRSKTLLLTNELIESRKLMLRLIERYKRSDYRHTDKEEGAVEYVARWCIEKWGELTGQDQGVHFVNKADLDARTAPRPQRNPFAPVSPLLYGLDGKPIHSRG